MEPWNCKEGQCTFPWVPTATGYLGTVWVCKHWNFGLFQEALTSEQTRAVAL